MIHGPPLDDERTAPGASDDAFDLHDPFAQQNADAGAALAHHPLPYGTQIEGYRITGLIGEGGFGVVYRAWDDALERHVAIKEYMPESLAVRGKASLQVSVRSERHRNTFEAGLKSFLNEARLLARFDHPALVKVFRFWEANRTAYMAMPYYDGPTLKAALDVIGTAPGEETLRDWLRPLLDALSVLHRQNYYHRDIAPDNILLTASGPLLLDFGAARHVISDLTQTITVVLKPGYAPIEQYGGDTFQGPWTDVYALAGVMRYAITGRTPVPSVERVVNDKQRPLIETHTGIYSDGFLRAIDAAQAVRPEDRPQDVAEFREMLNVGLAPDSPQYFRAPKVHKTDVQPSGVPLTGFDDLTATLPRSPSVAPARSIPVAEASRSGPRPAAVEVRPELRRLGRAAYALATVVLLAVGGGVWWDQVRQTRTPVATPQAVTAPSPAGGAEPAVIAPATPPAAKAASATPASPAPPTRSATVTPIPAPARPSAQDAPTAAGPLVELTPVPVQTPVIRPTPAQTVRVAPSPAVRPDQPFVPAASDRVGASPEAAPAPEPVTSRAPFRPAPEVAPVPVVVRSAPAAAPVPAPEAAPALAARPSVEDSPLPPLGPAPAVERPRQSAARSGDSARQRRETQPVRAPQATRESREAQAADEPAFPTTNAGVRPARCGDIVRKASLEPLVPEEAAYLRRECR